MLRRRTTSMKAAWAYGQRAASSCCSWRQWNVQRVRDGEPGWRTGDVAERACLFVRDTKVVEHTAKGGGVSAHAVILPENLAQEGQIYCVILVHIVAQPRHASRTQAQAAWPAHSSPGRPPAPRERGRARGAVLPQAFEHRVDRGLAHARDDINLLERGASADHS
jgi:hypothetical protein